MNDVSDRLILRQTFDSQTLIDTYPPKLHNAHKNSFIVSLVRRDVTTTVNLASRGGALCHFP